jgi:hypothetical protein
MLASFKMSDFGLLCFYLGIQVQEGSSGISLSQTMYARHILGKGAWQSAMPMEHQCKMSKQSATPPTPMMEYRSHVGSLRYLVHTQPNIVFAIGYVSRFMEKPTTEHLATVKCIMCYVARTIDYGCHYKPGGGLKPIGHNNADMAGDIDTHKSTTGVLFFLGLNPVTWQSQRQKVIALSSYKAEYIMGITAACQGVWLRKLLSELKFEPCTSFTKKMDNQSDVALCKNPVHHDGSKHIDTRNHFIRQCFGELRGLIRVDKINGEHKV